MPRSPNYPPPLIVSPLKEPHKTTLILLHGRGSNAPTFSTVLSHPLPNNLTLPLSLPNTKFIFPTASFCRATIYNRSTITQWFDNWSLHTEPLEREELQIAGLRETSLYLEGLLKAEVDRVGAGNVVLGGLSQGGAAALIGGLVGGEEMRLGGLVGMCTWLPLRGWIEAGLEEEDGGGEISFEQEGGEEDARGRLEQTMGELRADLGMSGSLRGEKKVPVFLGHGVLDEKVPVRLGRDAKDCLGRLGLEVDWREYKDLGHWYSGDMLGDLVKFLAKVWGLENPCGEIELSFSREP